jgi:predicted nucleic acid-binding protein
MKVLFDTCVIIDYLQGREPFFDDALNLMISAAENDISGYMTASSLTDIYYIIHRHTRSTIQSRHYLSQLTQLISMLDTTAEDCIRALHSAPGDFEDCVMMETARRCGMDHIVTRNINDYVRSAVPVISPSELLMLIDRDN